MDMIIKQKIVLIDDNSQIVDDLRKWVGRHLSGQNYEVVGFTDDLAATKFVLRNEGSIVGYIQDLRRTYFDVDENLSGIKFYNQVIDCRTPSAKTIICSASIPFLNDLQSHFVDVPNDKIRFVDKVSPGNYIKQVLDNINWLISPIHEDNKKLNKEDVTIVSLLEPAWDKLCKYLIKYPNYLHTMKPSDFEILAGEIFRSYGWQVEFTSRTRDGGYDVMAIKRSFPTDMCVLVEAKRYAPNRPVGVDIIRSLYGIRQLKQASQAVLVTSSYVTLSAKTEFERVIPWELDFIEREKILEWCRHYTDIKLGGGFRI